MDNQSITTYDNSQENDSEITRLQAKLSKLEDDLATLRTENEGLKKVQTDYVDICKENDKLKAQLENEKNNKQTSDSAVFTDDANLKELRKSLSTLRSDKEKLTNNLTESEKKLEKILAENKTLKDNYSAIQNENDRLKAQLKQFEDKFKEKSYDHLATDIKVKNGEISGFQNKSNELEEIMQLQKKNEEYVKEINDLNNLLQRKEKAKQELIEKNTNLKKEASQYQSALGSITNYRMNDNDKNHSVQLKKDIEELQYKLKNYVTTLKGDFEINFKAVINLMEKYNVKTKVTPKEPNKPLVKAVLQHHIIKKVTKDIRKYFIQNSKEGTKMHLEAEIATKATDLENKLVCFSKTRNGTDTTTQVASIKIRQEVNIALGNRGFSDYLSGEDYVKHVYIIIERSKLNKEMNKYRIIKDDTKKNYVEKLAEDLIREFIRIIHFRLKVQEPSAQVRWVKIGANIDPSIMEGNWDKDDIDNLEVEICSFPMIGRDLDDVAKRKVYTHAQVFTKRKKYPSYIEGSSIWSSQKIKGNLEPESDDDGV